LQKRLLFIANAVRISSPIIAGFLGFREAPALVEAFLRLCDTNPSLVPDCILVDGNGILHPRGYGLASHVGELKFCIQNGLIYVNAFRW
jgi:deoxyinosine 3'endonuclease (endonuclease V)